MYQVCYWDAESGRQKVRDATPEECNEIELRRQSAPSIESHNAPILAELARIDAKSIRPLREGDAVRVADLEAQAAALRLQLRKE